MTRLLFFTGSWCEPCKAMKQIMTGIPGVDMIDVDAQPEVAHAYRVMTVPTVIALRDGEIIGRCAGLATRERIMEMISG